MGFWSKLLGAEPAVLPVLPEGEATARERSQAEFHRDRFARAITQCRAAVALGEKPQGRLSELEQWHRYYAGLADAEAALPVREEEAA